MSGRHWFLPADSNVLGLLHEQATVTVEGMEAFAAWAAGDTGAADRVRACEHRADDAKREVLRALRTAFVTPFEPEDVFALSRAVDWILNHAKDAVGESEVMACPPDAVVSDMAGELVTAVRQLEAAILALGAGDGDPAAAAEAAIKAERRLEKSYRRGMAALLELEDLREVTARRELYRRCSRIGENVDEVAERVIYAVVKES
jgi:uncharacterized protein Yka (UPF0111/DUF47 family)